MGLNIESYLNILNGNFIRLGKEDLTNQLARSLPASGHQGLWKNEGSLFMKGDSLLHKEQDSSAMQSQRDCFAIRMTYE